MDATTRMRRGRRHGPVALGAALSLMLLGPGDAAAAVDRRSIEPEPATAAASWCSAAAARPTTTRSGRVIVADNFESGSLSTNWTKTDEGDAWAGVTTSWRRSGLCAGRLIVTSSSTSRANIQRSLPWDTDDVWAIGWFRVNRQGYSGSNVPTFRFFNGSQRILDVYRQNISGDLWLRTASGTGSWRYVRLNRTLALSTWYKIEVRVRPAWGSSHVSIWLNGSEIHRTWSMYLPASRLTTVMVGAEHVRQVMDLAFDDVILTAS